MMNLFLLFTMLFEKQAQFNLTISWKAIIMFSTTINRIVHQRPAAIFPQHYKLWNRNSTNNGNTDYTCMFRIKDNLHQENS